MHQIVGIASWFMLLASFVLLSVDITTAADNLAKQEKALNIIDDFANRICVTVPQTGTSGNIELSGKAKAELNEMLKKIANLGIEGAAKYQTSDWQGVLQRDLAEQLNRSRNCKLEVFKDLKDRLLAGDQKIYSQTSPPPGSVDPLPPGRVSQITRFQLPGQPTLFNDGSNDDQYRKAKEILDIVTARHGMKVDRVEVIKWINLDRDKAKQLPEGLLSELSARGYRISSQLRRPSDMNPFDPRRDQFWTEVYDFQARNHALGQSIIGYWSVGSLGAGNYMLLWAWALLP